jgi:hypothetical protein
MTAVCVKNWRRFQVCVFMIIQAQAESPDPAVRPSPRFTASRSRKLPVQELTACQKSPPAGMPALPKLL